jgi:hypothetical protein
LVKVKYWKHKGMPNATILQVLPALQP